MGNKLYKNERLKSRTVIKNIFKHKQSFIAYPIRINWIEQEEKGAKVVFAAPKRNFKKAVDRNRIKRLLRESYRLNKTYFLNQLKLKNKGVAIYIGYIGKEIEPYATIEEKIKLSLVRLLNEIEKNR